MAKQVDSHSTSMGCVEMLKVKTLKCLRVTLSGTECLVCQSFDRYTDAINDANVQLRNMASKYETVHFVDCSDVFLEVKAGLHALGCCRDRLMPSGVVK